MSSVDQRPAQPARRSTPAPSEVAKVVVGSRAEAKALRKAAETAERERAVQSKAASKRVALEKSGVQRAQAAANDGTATWTLADAVVVLAVMGVCLVAKEAALNSRAIQVLPAAALTGARALVLGVYYAVQLAALAFVAHAHGGTISTAFGLGRLGRSWEHRSVSAGLVVALAIGTRMASLAWGAFAQAAGWEPPMTGPLTAVFGAGGAGLALSVLMVVVAGPVVEELVFRGAVLGAAGDRWGMWPAVLGSAGLFALSHATAWALVPWFVLGVALGWLAWHRGSLWPAVALHATYNAVVVGAAYWLAR